MDASFRSRQIGHLKSVLTLACGIAAVAPVVFIVVATMEARRDWAYWDEIDSVLTFLIQLKEGMDLKGFLTHVVAVSNEHRLIMSRLLFAFIYWTSGTINFALLDWLGISWILAGCATLVLSADGRRDRCMMAAMLGLAVFQLGNYENFLWSGASIDHFLVVALSVVTLVLLARTDIRSLALATLSALCASGTLAQGLAIWPAGFVTLLLVGSRQRALLWLIGGAAVLVTYLWGFRLNPNEKFFELSWHACTLVIEYWLAILGAPAVLGERPLAPFAGACLVALIAALFSKASTRRRPTDFGVLAYMLCAAAMIAAGRTADSGGIVHSRYYILGSIAWALVLFILVREANALGGRLRLVPWAVLAVLTCFNIAANTRFYEPTQSWIECRNLARSRFGQNGIDGQGPFALHPIPAHATRVLERAEQLGIYQMEQVSHATPKPDRLIETNRITYYIDEISVNKRSLFVRGWVALDGHSAKRGSVQMVLFSEQEKQFYSTLSIRRPDVAQATGIDSLKWAGFRFVRRRSLMPAGEYGIGLLVNDGKQFLFSKTAHRVKLVGEGHAILASE